MNLGHSYPYKALSPLTGKNILFNNISDVYRHLQLIYEQSKRKDPETAGESLFIQGSFFYDLTLILNQKIQDLIKAYSFCKSFSCPPFPSLQETPEDFINDFTIIDREIAAISKSKQKKVKNG